MGVVRTYVAHGGLRQEDAERIGSFFERTFGDKPFTQHDVVRRARPKSSPIHCDFEWDDAKAAHEHRLEQAKFLIRHVKVVERVEDDREIVARAYHHVSVVSSEGVTTGYVSDRVVWRDPALSVQVVERALRELIGWKERYGDYKDLAWFAQRLGELLDEYREREAA
jgi:hypothetical protein